MKLVSDSFSSSMTNDPRDPGPSTHASLPESFVNHPKSVTEIKGDRSGAAADQTPRDVLIQTLRELDEGTIDPEALAVVFKPRVAPGDPQESPTFYVSSPNAYITHAMLSMTIYHHYQSIFHHV